MILDEKLLDNVNIDDIKEMIIQEVCESLRLDYKQKWWGNNDEGRREMLRDISAFANASGGYLVLGVKTESSKGAGHLDCPTKIVALEHANYAEKINRGCRDNLDPPCRGIEVAQFEADQNGVILVIKVPPSLDAPHMVTFKGLNQFWERHGTDKQPMETHEIRDLFITRRSNQDLILQQAQQGVLKFQFANIDKGGALYIWAAPVVPLQTDVDLKNRELRELFYDQAILNPDFRPDIYCGRPRACLDGVEAVDSGNETGKFIRLKRNGFLEIGTTRTLLQDHGTYYIHPFSLSVILENFTSFATKVYSKLEAQGPVALGCSFIKVEGYKLYLGQRFMEEYSAAWESDTLPLGHQISYDFQAEKNVIVKAISDRLWNAFHYDQCPYFNLEGELVRPN